MIPILLHALPDTLSPEEQYELLKQLETGSVSARQKLIEHNLQLVRYIVRTRYYNTPFEEEELFSVGIIGLIKAVDRFSLEKNIKFNTFAWRCIENDILIYLRRIRHVEKEESYEEYAEINHEAVEDKKPTVLESYLKNETIEELKEALLKVPERKRTMLLMHIGWNREQKCYSYTELANYFGIGRTSVSKHVHHAIRIIQKEYEQKNGIYLTCSHTKTKK